MRVRATSLLCVTALLLGVLVSVMFDVRSFLAPVEADLFSANKAADEEYERLLQGTHALSDASRLLSRIAALTVPSIVHIQSIRQDGQGRRLEETGSGVVIRADNPPGDYVVTNRHVVADYASLEDVSIHLHDGRVIHPLRIWEDRASDVAVFKVNGERLQPARWGDSDSVEVGQMVLAVGSPFGLSHSVTFGIVSAKGRRSLELGEQGARPLINQDFLQTDAAINPGNSGGPLIDLQGRVIGINTAIASNGGGNEGIGFSIPSNLVRWVVEQLLEHDHVRRAYLGVMLDPDFDAEKAARYKLDRLRGAFIAEVYANTPASRANLKPRDVILSFDGIDVQDENHLINLVSLSEIGKTVRIVVLRDGKELAIEVVLSDRDRDLQSQLPQLPQQPGMGTSLRTMGLTLYPMDKNLSKQLGFDPSATGLLVLKIDRRGPLHGTVKLYDLIQEVARVPVNSLDDLQQQLDRNSESTPLVIKVSRRVGGKRQQELVVWKRTIER